MRVIAFCPYKWSRVIWSKPYCADGVGSMGRRASVCSAAHAADLKITERSWFEFARAIADTTRWPSAPYVWACTRLCQLPTGGMGSRSIASPVGDHPAVWPSHGAWAFCRAIISPASNSAMPVRATSNRRPAPYWIVLLDQAGWHGAKVLKNSPQPLADAATAALTRAQPPGKHLALHCARTGSLPRRRAHRAGASSQGHPGLRRPIRGVWQRHNLLTKHERLGRRPPSARSSSAKSRPACWSASRPSSASVTSRLRGSSGLWRGRGSDMWFASLCGSRPPTNPCSPFIAGAASISPATRSLTCATLLLIVRWPKTYADECTIQRAACPTWSSIVVPEAVA